MIFFFTTFVITFSSWFFTHVLSCEYSWLYVCESIRYKIFFVINLMSFSSENLQLSYSYFSMKFIKKYRRLQNVLKVRVNFYSDEKYCFWNKINLHSWTFSFHYYRFFPHLLHYVIKLVLFEICQEIILKPLSEKS